jgi:hypothetical protein
MRALRVLVSILALALIVAMASPCWADGRNKAHYAGKPIPPHYGWYKQPYRGHGYPVAHRGYSRPYPYPYREEVHRYYYVPVPQAVYVPVPVYSGNYISGGIAQPGWAFSWAVNLP